MAEPTSEQLSEALNELVHAYRDLIDDYGHISSACKKAEALLPGYDDTPMFHDYGTGD